MKASANSPTAASASFLPCVFSVAACLMFSMVCLAAPSITLSKKTGPPTSQILVSGRGFEPNVGVDMYFDTKDEVLVVTDRQGRFEKAKVYAPKQARPGQHWVTALERNNDKGAQMPFLVQTDWPQFHFEADGTRLNPYENVLTPKTVRGLGLKWSYTTGNEVWSSPAVANGVVYVGSGTWTDFNIYALNAKTGAKLWSYDPGGWTLSSPAVADGVVYVGVWAYSRGGVYALNAKTGQVLWTNPSNDVYTSSPTVANGVLYIGTVYSNSVYALDAKSGRELWTYNAGAFVQSSPAVVNGVVYVSAGGDGQGQDGVLYALNAKTGAKLWSYPIGGCCKESAPAQAYLQHIRESSPAVADGVVYVGSWDGTVYALNAASGALLWSYATGGDISSSPAVANEVVYIGSFYIGSGNSSTYALNARTGALLWATNIGSGENSPAVANGVVYLGSWDNNVYALNASTGAVLWSYATGTHVECSPTVVNGKVYIGSDDDNMYAFALTDNGRSKQDAASKRPDPTTLRPDFGLKATAETSLKH
jgi:outer membrane protein assembly factor BamB